MLILILTPICFAMALARYGTSGNTYIVMREDENIQRHRGRDLNLRHRHLMKIMSARGVEFHEYTPDEISAILNSSNRDLAIDFQLTGKLWRLGLLPIQDNGTQGRRRVELLSFGTDNLIPFSNFYHTFMSARAFKEYGLWKKHFRNLRADAMIVPSNNTNIARRYRRTKLETIEIEKIRITNLEVTSIITSDLPKEIVKDNNRELIVLSPEGTELNIEHINELVQATNKVINNNPGNFQILIKPHPSSPIADLLIDEISSKFDFTVLNHELNIQSKLLQSIPIEFIFFARPNSYFVGIPSSAIVFLNSDRVTLIAVPDKKLSAQLKRSYKYFLQFNKFDSPF